MQVLRDEGLSWAENFSYASQLLRACYKGMHLVGDLMDIVSPEKRSQMMAGIKGKNTKPEMIVRKLVHGMGFRFRLHRKTLPGSPDLVFPRLRRVIFVHGCFWHRHPGCRLAYTPKSNAPFWLEKLEGNVRRDSFALKALDALGWEVLIVWECEVSNLPALAQKLNCFLAAG
ncbi:DNA mismatch endonuclease (patch repair protein) [Ottowia thiooxydans]|uniref:DNA mismatch endonuclease (Patch repair protein) n=2 Tax=Ottowia thiooxydans TaxID=219182 RepID=A0ABV2Q841_9BURK